MREAWLLNGFVPQTPTEQAAFEREKLLVRFDPCAEAHRLKVADKAANWSAKRVLSALTNDNREREECCWAETQWSVLRAGGVATGLTAFLAAVKSRLVQLVTGMPLD